jgi:hypothetical protein
VKGQLRTVRVNIRKSNTDMLIVVFRDFIIIPLFLSFYIPVI